MGAPKFLVVRLTAIGDVIHALPAVMDLRSSFPEAEIDWLVETTAAPLIRNSQIVSRVIEISTRRWRERMLAPATLRQIGGTITALRRARYDWAVDFQGLWKSGLLARLSGAREVIGFHSSDLREPSARVLYSRQAGPARGMHRIERNRNLLKIAGLHPSGPARYPATLWTEEDSRNVEKLSRELDPSLVVINPGAAWPTKLWRASRFGQLARRIHQEFGHQIVCTFGPGEESLVRAVEMHAKPSPVVPLKLSISEFACFVRRARMFIGGDTGPMHIAAAFQVPILSVFGPTSVPSTGPYQTPQKVVQHILPCSHCYRRSCWHHSCMKIETDEVWSGFLELEGRLNSSRSQPVHNLAGLE